jgi:hypothetical protein
VEQGERLSALADMHGVPNGEVLGLLLDHGARTGFGNTLALPGIEITAKGDRVEIKIDTIPLRPHSAAQSQSVAASLRSVASASRATLNMDCPDPIEVTRRGNGVVVTVCRDGVTIVCRVFSPGVARAFADRLEEASRLALVTTELETVEQLLGDLDLGDLETAIS